MIQDRKHLLAKVRQLHAGIEKLLNAIQEIDETLADNYPVITEVLQLVGYMLIEALKLVVNLLQSGEI